MKSFKFIWILCILASCKVHRIQNEDSTITNNSEDKNELKEKSSPETIMVKYAALLNTSSEKLYNAKLYSYIDQWMGIKYKWGGMDKDGVDCSGFVNLVYKNVYNYQLKRSGFDIAKECNEIEKNNLMEGDLVFFDISSKNSHMGIYLANNKFVHASSSKGVIISDLNENYWIKYWGRAARTK